MHHIIGSLLQLIFVLYSVSRPPSRLSTASAHGEAPAAAGAGVIIPVGRRGTTPSLDVNPSTCLEEQGRLNSVVAGEGVKLSILAKSKAIEDQVTNIVTMFVS